ncbi:unnamed protein product, partial [Mesorhabditis belari]|uniref:UDP-galactose transporter n=1 Tax=Mesorhabditis belari TaxID=2138241 RepID=A0AAF3FGB3_9BILA
MSSFAYKYGGLLALTLQQAAMPLLVRYTRYRSPDEVFITTVNVFMMDVIKFIVCSMILIRSTSFLRFLKDLYSAFWVNRIETLKVCIPAVIYVLQNNLYYIAGTHLEATTIYICYQLKMFTTAFLMRLMLGKRFSGKQWIALCILVAGVINVQLIYSPPSTNEESVEQNPMIGFSAVFLMCFTSALAGVYLEKVLKGSEESVWIQNVRLALVGLPISAISMFAYDLEAIKTDGFFRGWDFWVLILTIFNSVGGLLIAVVMKYADNILKAFAQSMAIIGAALGSWMLFDFVPGFQFMFGAAMVMFSIVLYSLYPYRPSSTFDLQKIKSKQILPTTKELLSK